ncbi:hypothetical protein BZG36_00426 [Bifiguratus adelaidae]|uniref:Uncharacterized protein n=1 Tax=Bifiguratus adelaidae TaxID=1938954 RepID=A0A261Y825_9FUNG|nr:hypothetical protein BZG36_00426 [Bifiguratus adelaidae]
MNAAANAYQAHLGEAPQKVLHNKDKEAHAGTMLANTWQGKEKLEMKQVPRPAVTDEEDIVMRITGSTVCGSDLHLYHGEILQLKAGDVLGHEAMGVVEEVGPKVTNVKVGDRVVAAFNIACGQCQYCKQGRYTACDFTNNSRLQEQLYGHRIAGVLGYSHFVGGYTGCQAEYTRIPFANTNVIKVPDDLPDERALYLSDIVPTSYHACWEANVQQGEDVAIWGAGPVGLNCAQWCRNVFKANRIFLVDNVPERLELAVKKWNVIPVNFDEGDVVEQIHKQCPNGVHRSIDAAAFRYGKGLMHKFERAVGLETDTSEILNEAIRATTKVGTIAIIADYAAYCNHFNIGAVMEKGIRLIGCGQAPIQRHWKKNLEYIQNGQFDPTAVVTHRFKLEEVPEIYYRFDQKEAGIIKTFVETKFSNPPSPGMPKTMKARIPNSALALAQSPILYPSAPLSGTVWKQGQTVIISWTQPSVPDFQITLAQGSSNALQQLSVIAQNVVASKMSYNWDIPTDLPPASNYALEFGTSPNLAFAGPFTVESLDGSPVPSSSASPAAVTSSGSGMTNMSGASPMKTGGRPGASGASASAKAAASSESARTAVIASLVTLGIVAINAALTMF